MTTKPINEAMSTIALPDIIPDLVPFIVSRIQRYHELFEQPLIAEFWEETLHKSFNMVTVLRGSQTDPIKSVKTCVLRP
jgi:hypothetical protein